MKNKKNKKYRFLAKYLVGFLYLQAQKAKNNRIHALFGLNITLNNKN